MLPEQWQTDRLYVRNALPENVDRLQAIFNANNHVEIWDPTFRYAPRAEIAELVDASVAGLSKRGKPFQLQAFGPELQTLAGYYRIVEFDGDRLYSAEGHASVILEYGFRQPAKE